MNSREWLLKFFEDKIGENRTFSTRVEMAEYLGIPKTQATRLFNFLKGSDTQYSSVIEWFEKLGGQLVGPDCETTKEVCFVDAKVSPSGEFLPPPTTEDYIAVPLVGEVGAGPGMVDQEELISWVLVHSQSLAVRNRNNLLAVVIGRNQRSMVPTLHPEDIVLVNRDDYGQYGYAPPGNIFLVRDPGMDGGMVKRVSVTEKGRRSTITLYSDNPEYGPETFHLDEYDNDIKKAIVGRVVWAWTDLSRK